MYLIIGKRQGEIMTFDEANEIMPAGYVEFDNGEIKVVANLDDYPNSEVDFWTNEGVFTTTQVMEMISGLQQTYAPSESKAVDDERN